ncbi:hypothetical protein ACH429_16805 [Streptomyces pathocidini]|uniref:Uncharacterized protein n=1 Tax=Streptomyces pathocidini TaxID=1650571 RepID=A0ABW7UWD8_9ACTN|nr:hypothetical protein [Streptomyces pathocidini]
MTHSGQGNEPQLPATRPAYEGVVLPAHGDPYVPDQQTVPAAGQPWGQPWGPDPAEQQPQVLPGSEAAPAPAVSPEQTQQLRRRDLHQGLRQGHDAGAPGGPAHGQAAGAPDAEATQFIPPVPGGGPLPPEVPAETTTFLGRRPLPPQSQPGGSDAEATQFIGAPIPGAGGAHAAQSPELPARTPYGIRPGMPGDRQPPSEFDGLFRADGGPEAAAATQQLPAYGAQQPAVHQPYGQQPSYGGPQAPSHAQRGPHGSQDPDGDEKPRKGLSRGVLIGMVVAGCAVVGLVAGAVLSGDGDDTEPAGSVAQSSAPAENDGGESAPAADPAEGQAKDLDALLADSNNSRAAVIKSVQSINGCKNLDQAAQDLRDAAGQRNGLVSRLQKMSVDRLPNHQALTNSLTRAWKASAAADDHYAAWADQVAAAGKKGCPKGRARITSHTGAGNKASGDATQAKQQAAALWNQIATKYGLTKRQVTEL